MALVASLAVAQAALAVPPGSPSQLPENQRVVALSPAIQDVEVVAGHRTRLHFTVRNSTLLDLGFRVGVTDAAPGDEQDGGVRLGADPGSSRTASGWMDPVDERLSIRSGTEQDVQVDVDVPRDAAPGGYYAAVVVRALPPAGTAVVVEAQLSSLVLLTVRGAIRHDLRASISPVGRVRSGPPVEWDVTLANRGNVHETVSGRVVVESLLGRTHRLPLRRMIVLPGVTRTQRVRAEVRNAPDVVRSRLELDGYGMKQGRKVIVLPGWLAVVAGVLVALAWWRRRRRRTLERWLEDDPDRPLEG